MEQLRFPLSRGRIMGLKQAGIQVFAICAAVNGLKLGSEADCCLWLGGTRSVHVGQSAFNRPPKMWEPHATPALMHGHIFSMMFVPPKATAIDSPLSLLSSAIEARFSEIVIKRKMASVL